MSERACPSCGATASPASRCGRCGAVLSVRGLEVEALLFLTPYTRVYRARGASGLVALKELVFGVAPDAKTVNRFEREGRVLRELSHPRVPAFVEAFTDGEGRELRLYLAQAFVPGENLEARLAHHRFDEDEARRVATDLLEVLEYLHGRSPALIHRDVKPSNIIARPDGSCVLVDFGAVRDLGSSQPVSGAGTFDYMPPEQLSSEVDGRADLYSLGATLVRVLSRRTISDLRTSELELVFRPYVNVSEAFSGFLERLVARAPRERFASAKEALAQLRRIPALTQRPEAAESPATRLEVSVAEIRRAAKPPPPPKPTTDVQWVPAQLHLEQDDEGARPWVLRVEERAFGLRPGGSYVIGRGSDADIVVDERWHRADTVSRRHARISVLRDGLRVDDLGSRNGTRVGAMQLLQGQIQMRLRAPAQLALGKLVAELVPWRSPR